MCTAFSGSRRRAVKGGLLCCALTWAAACALAEAPWRPGDRPWWHGEPPGRRVERPLPKLPRTRTRFYWIYSKLDQDIIREAAARLTAVAKEYHRRTSGFRPTVKSKLPIYIFGNYDDYHAAGGPEHSAGVYLGKAVLVVWDPEYREDLWRTLQHECFHQFARRSVGGCWPVWLSEGMATYFEEGMWTGDGFVAGLIRPEMLRDVRALIKSGKVKKFADFMRMDRKTWNEAEGEEQHANYTQAWAMVHFLAHADSERYRGAVAKLIKASAALPGGTSDVRAAEDDYQKAQRGLQRMPGRVFGPRLPRVEARYKQWWLSLSDDPTAHRFAKATVATLASFLARAHLQGLRFRTAGQFFAAARQGKIRPAPKGREGLWLPGSLLQQQLRQASKLSAWSLGEQGRYPTLAATTRDGLTLVATFALERGKTLDIEVRSIRRKTTAARGGRSHTPGDLLDADFEDPEDALDPEAAAPAAKDEPPGRRPQQKSDERQKQAARLLGMARNWIMNQRKDKARPLLKRVIGQYPHTAAAAQAKALLKTLD